MFLFFAAAYFPSGFTELILFFSAHSEAVNASDSITCLSALLVRLYYWSDCISCQTVTCQRGLLEALVKELLSGWIYGGSAEQAADKCVKGKSPVDVASSPSLPFVTVSAWFEMRTCQKTRRLHGAAARDVSRHAACLNFPSHHSEPSDPACSSHVARRGCTCTRARMLVSIMVIC